MSRNAILPASVDPAGTSRADDADSTHPPDAEETATADDALWFALCIAPDEGIGIGELMQVTGMSRPTLYRYLTQHAKAGRAIQVGWGRWRAVIAEEPHGE